jgi:hypothetical protein
MLSILRSLGFFIVNLFKSLGRLEAENRFFPTKPQHCLLVANGRIRSSMMASASSPARATGG